MSEVLSDRPAHDAEMDADVLPASAAHKADGHDNGLQVIGAGFGRTGTLSLKVALEQLGYDPCYHMVEALTRPKHKKAWGGALQAGTTPDLKELLQGFKATVDWPGCHYYRELTQLYPDAKVILTVRDPEQWWSSAKNTIFSGGNLLAKRARCYARWLVRPDPMMAGMDKAVLGGMFKHRFKEDKEFALQVFQAWVDEVKATVPAERLLVYSISDGWEPLCEFLGKPVPSKPFPHRNSTTEFHEVVTSSVLKLGVRRRQLLTWLASVLDVAALGALGAAAVAGVGKLQGRRGNTV